MRLSVYKAVIFAALGLIGVRLFDVQVVHGAYYRMLSDRNRIRVIPIPAPRGEIRDVKGRLLATNVPLWELHVVREDLRPGESNLLGKLLGESEQAIEKRLNAKTPDFVPAVLKRELTFEEVVRIEEHALDLPAARVVTRAVRSYPYGASAAHLVGYLGKITQKEYERDGGERFLFDDVTGREGLEARFDGGLQGSFGGRQVEVDAEGREIRVLGEKNPQAGQSLRLTIDAELQKRVGELLTGKKGAIGVMDLETDGLLALVSAPSFDPNVFVRPQGSGERGAVLKDAQAPLLNRGVASSYPAGSVFKLVTALAALETGKITPSTTFVCRGSFQLHGRGRPFKCWKSWGHGALDLYGAIEQSCNVYFYNVASRLSPDDLATWARRIGFGETWQLEVPHFTPGLVPDPVWKQTAVREKWYQGETVSFGIGQSYLLVTPVQMLRLVGLFANPGVLSEPHLLADRKPRRTVLAVKPETLNAIRAGMERVVERDSGTGNPARVKGFAIAAKTGTAQVPPREAHAWFVGYAPMRDPKVAVFVFVEHGGSGGAVAGSMAKHVFEAWRDLNRAALLA